MTDEPQHRPLKPKSPLSQEVGAKAARKLRARRHVTRTVWFGLGMMGLIGWSVAIPTLLGAVLGIWLDNHHPGSHSWTLMLLVIGLDALWGGLFAFSLAVKLAALLVILAGYVLASYALIENRYFSGVVRLQTDRGHQVVSSGPYRWVRHPGYAGLLLTYLGTPFFLDSLWAFVPTAILLVALFLRTSLEDRFLQDRVQQ